MRKGIPRAGGRCRIFPGDSRGPLIQHNQARLYSLLFVSAADTLLAFGRNNLKANLGITAVIHTWSQNLLDHYHLHCVVTGGGLALDGQQRVSLNDRWLFPVRALSLVFRAKFRDGLQQLFDEGQLQFPKAEPQLADPAVFTRWRHHLCRHKWVVYAKRPFAGPQSVLAYLCRYTHRVAITNRRLQALDPQTGTITFHYKDYANGSQIRAMTLQQPEFLRRFCLRILPPRFVKIRHFGLLANRDRSANLAQARALLPQRPANPAATQPAGLITTPAASPPLVCPHCGHQTLMLIRFVPRPTRPPTLDSS